MQPREEKPILSHMMVMKLDVQVFYTPSLKKLRPFIHLAGRGEIFSVKIVNEFG